MEDSERNLDKHILQVAPNSRDLQVSYLRIILTCLRVARNLIQIKTRVSSNLLKSLLLDLVLWYYRILFCSSTFFQNTANQRSPATCCVNHNKSADRPPVCRGTMTRLSTPSPCQPRHLLTNTISGIVIDYCSIYRHGMPLLAVICLPCCRTSMRQEHQQ